MPAITMTGIVATAVFVAAIGVLAAGATVQVDLVAIDPALSPRKEGITTDRIPQPLAGAGYSPAVRVGDLVFVAGQLGLKPGDAAIEGDIAAQTEQVMRNLAAILGVAGSSLDNLVKTTVYLQHLEDFAAMNEVYARHVGDRPPARSAFQVAALPMGALVDRFGRRRFLTAGALLMAAASLAFTAIHSFGPAIFALRAVQALAFAMAFAAGSALAVDEAPPERVAQAIGLFGLTEIFLQVEAGVKEVRITQRLEKVFPDFREIFRRWRTLLRSGAIGVIIGVMFLITVVSVVEGMNRYMEEDFAGTIYGLNTVTVSRTPEIEMNSNPDVWREYWRRPRITFRDADAIRAGLSVPALVLLVFGVVAFMPRRMMPYVESPMVGVVSMMPGLSAEEMEIYFSKPIEERMVDLKNVHFVRSTSQEGFSIVTVEFWYGTDMKKALFDVQALMNVVQADLPMTGANLKGHNSRGVIAISRRNRSINIGDTFPPPLPRTSMTSPFFWSCG